MLSMPFNPFLNRRCSSRIGAHFTAGSTLPFDRRLDSYPFRKARCQATRRQSMSYRSILAPSENLYRSSGESNLYPTSDQKEKRECARVICGPYACRSLPVCNCVQGLFMVVEAPAILLVKGKVGSKFN